MSAVTFEELQHLLDLAPFTRLYNFRLHSMHEGEAVLLIPFNKELERPGGLVAGPVYMAAADVAMWLAIATKTGRPEADMTLTVEMKTNFLSSAKGEDVYCKGRVLKAGRRLLYGTAECYTAPGKLLTHHTLTYMRPE